MHRVAHSADGASSPPARQPPSDRGSERNLLLLGLPRAEYERLAPHLRDVTLPQGTILAEACQRITRVYFPQRAVVSLLAVVDSGRAVEVALVGNDGVIGVSVCLGATTSPHQAVTQIPDDARYLTTDRFRRALAPGSTLRRITLLYADALMRQLSQSLACNSRHTVKARCARWLLMAHDRVGLDEFLLTQDYLGQMLGVRRPTVSEAAGELQSAGAIHYSRGHITVTHRGRLERAACACYGMLERDERHTPPLSPR